jgi:hypothetical protein
MDETDLHEGLTSHRIAQLLVEPDRGFSRMERHRCDSAGAHLGLEPSHETYAHALTLPLGVNCHGTQTPAREVEQHTADQAILGGFPFHDDDVERYLLSREPHLVSPHPERGAKDPVTKVELLLVSGKVCSRVDAQEVHAQETQSTSDVRLLMSRN